MKDLLPLLNADAGAGDGAAAAPTAEGTPTPASDVEPARGSSRYGTPSRAAAPAAQATPAQATAAPQAATPEATPAQPDPAADPAAEAAPAPDDASASAEPAVEETPAESPAETPAAAAEMIRRAIPGAVVENDEQAEVYVRQLAREADGMNDLRATIQEVPELAAFFRALGEGSAPRLAAVEAFRDLASAPDPEDPEYADWLRAEGARKERQRIDRERAAETQVQRQQRRDAMEASLNAFVQRNPDVDADNLREQFYSLFEGDRRTKAFRGDAYEVVYNGLNHKQLVADAEKAARADEREKVLAEVRGQSAAQEADPLALGEGSGGGVASLDPATLTPAERRRMELAGRLLGSGGPTTRYGTRPARA